MKAGGGDGCLQDRERHRGMAQENKWEGGMEELEGGVGGLT